MKTIEVKRQLLEEALDQLKRAQQDCYVPYTQNVIDELEVVFLQPDVTKSVTAVEWLKEQYDSCPPYEQFLGETEWEQAKMLEKQQIKDAWLNCDYNSAEEYYNETFKSE